MSKRSNTNVVIFDFDGTLADVIPLMRQIYTDFAKTHDYPELTEEQYLKLRKASLREVMTWVGVRPWQVTGLLREGRRRFYERRDEVELFEGTAELIESLHSNGWDIYILSSNSVVTIREILERNKVAGYIKVLKRPPLFGKASSIKNLIRKHRYQKSLVWMIGDEVRDIEAANKAKVNSIGVSWGLQHEDSLAKANPTHLALNVAKIEEILLNSSSDQV